MRTLFSALLFSLISFSSSGLMSAGKSQAANPDSKTLAANQLFAKGQPHFPVLKEHGKLFFDFVVQENRIRVRPRIEDAVLQGQWQTFVITPDKRRYEGPTINIESEPTTFRILVEPPILFGTYTVVVKNISVQFSDGSPFTGSFLADNGQFAGSIVQVSNTFNSKLATFNIQSSEQQNFFNLENLPNHSIQGFFIPTPNFISE
jgi:hypothetical protein